mgnify:CR=1 FL=1
MMIAALHPLFSEVPKRDPFRRAVLLGIALGANFGGIATPIGTGPSAIAIAAVSSIHAITFTEWMLFALPLALGLLIAGLRLLLARFHIRGKLDELSAVPVKQPNRGGLLVMMVFFLTVAAWLTEPLHGTPSATVAPHHYRGSLWFRSSETRVIFAALIGQHYC